MKSKKRTITLSALMLVMVLSLTYVVTNIGAWLTDKQETGDITISVGEVKYVLANKDVFIAGPVVPGENIVEGNNLNIKNASTVDSQIRFSYKLTITLDDKILPNKDLLVEFNNSWKKYDGDENYYLNGKDLDSGRILKTDVTEYGILDTIFMDGTIFGNDFKGATIKLSITFQAKQAEHLTWGDAGSINFSTGI